MPTTTPPITPLPTPVPSRADRTNFAARADAFLAALPTLQTELDAVGEAAYDNAVEAESNATAAAASAAASAASASAASASAISAAQAAGASVWVAGSYASGAVAYSPSSGLVYRRKAPGGASPTDPASDAANWVLAVVAAARYVPESGASISGLLNTEHAMRNAAVSTLVLPDPASLVVGDVIGLSVENGRADNLVTLTGAAKFNGESQPDNQLQIDDPFARLLFRWTGATYGWSA